MNKESIIKLYKSKLIELEKHNSLYYDKSQPKISDSEYDDLKNEIINLEIKYKFLKSKSSPSKIVGYKPS